MRLFTCPNPGEYIYYVLTITLSKNVIISLMETIMIHDLKSSQHSHHFCMVGSSTNIPLALGKQNTITSLNSDPNGTMAACKSPIKLHHQRLAAELAHRSRHSNRFQY